MAFINDRWNIKVSGVQNDFQGYSCSWKETHVKPDQSGQWAWSGLNNCVDYVIVHYLLMEYDVIYNMQIE